MTETKNKKQPFFNCLYNFLKFAAIGGGVAFALFFYAPIGGSLPAFAASVSLNDPAQSCLVSGRIVNLSWTSELSGDPAYYILRKLESETSYTKIGNTSFLAYTDNTALSDKNYLYQIKAIKEASTYFSNEKTANAYYCPPTLSAPAALCQSDGPHNNLSWTAVSGDLAKYEVWRDGAKIGETAALNYDDGFNITGTTNYTYFIKSIWQNGASGDSDTGQAAALACPPVLTVNSACNDAAPGGPAINLSWNNLLGVARYEVYRKAQSETSYSLLATVSPPSATYKDNLAASLPFSYWQAGNISYFVKAVWDTAEKDSGSQEIAIPRCAPFVSTTGVCDASNNPEMHLAWIRTMSANLYNLYRDSATFLGQTSSTVNSYVDYLDSDTCPGGICSHNYRTEASVTGFPNFVSNTVTQSIDCVTVNPPSPPPSLNEPLGYCDSGESKILISWSPSNNVIYYTLYRNGQALVNLSGTSYVDAGVESGISYSYYAIAYGKAGTSVVSDNTKTITAVDCAPPSIPTLALSKTCVSGLPRINLSWSATNNTVNYEIKRGLSAGGLVTKVIFNQSSPEYASRSWQDTDVNPSTTYYYQVIANSILGVSPSASAVSLPITTDSCLPTVPNATLSADCNLGNARVKVSWASDNANTHHYEIFRQDVSTSVPINTVYPADTSYSWTDTVVSQSISYNYKVEAVGYLPGQRATQGYKPVTTYNCAPPGLFTLTDPPNIYCQGSYPRSDLSWTSSTNVTSYDLFRNRLNADDSIAETNTISNVTSTYTDFGFGKALSFDGSNDYVNVPNSASLQITGNLTISFWAYPTNITKSRQNPIGKAYGGEFNLTMETTGSLSYYQGSAGGNTSPHMSCSIVGMFSNNKWVNVTIVRNLAAKTIAVYKNGVAQTTSCSGWVTPSVSTRNLSIGYEYAGYWQGNINEVRIYNRDLSATEIAEHYNGIFTSETGLVGLWHFDEGSGQTVSDSSNYGNNGRLGSTSGADANDPTWVSSGLQSQIKYNWQTKAIGPGGTTLSNTTSPATLPLCLPTKPGLVLSTFCEGGANPAVRLNWSYSINTSIYEIYREGALINPINTVSQSDPKTWIDNNGGAGLNNETSYTYYIKAIGPTGLINQSDSRSITTPLCVLPSKPENLTAAFSCSGSYPRVNLAWDASSNATGYSIYRNINGGSYSFLATTSATAYTNIYSSVNVNTAYSYYIVATGPGGSSIPSDSASVPAGNYCTPSVPVISSLTTSCISGNSRNTISWSDATVFNTQKYEIYRGTANDFSLATLVRPPIDKVVDSAIFTSRIWPDDSGLSFAIRYYYWVKSIGPTGYFSTPSSSASVITYTCTPPIAPSVSVSDICSSYNKPITLLNWNKTSNTNSYNLYKNGVLNKTITPDSSGYIRNWLIIGGFSYTGTVDTALAADYLGGEANVKPRAGESVGGKTWFEYSVPSSNYTDFTLTSAPMSALTPKTYASAYAFAYVYSPIAQTAQLRIGSDDGVKAFLNGSVIYTNTTQRGASPDQDIKAINLLAGMNNLLIKVQQGAGGWGLYARITDTSGNSILNDVTAWDSGAVAGVVANYNVSSIGPGGTSDPSSNIVASNPPFCLPAKPIVSALPECAGANTLIALSWPADSNTSSWTIYKKRSSEAGFNLLVPTTTLTSYTDLNVQSGISYDYLVRAFGQGASSTSDITTAIARSDCYDAPIKPVIIVGPQCAGSASRMKIIWAPYDNSKTLSFNIYRQNTTIGEAGFTKIYENLSGDRTEFVDGAVTANNKYIYKVEAIGLGADKSTMSDSSSEQTALDCLNIVPFYPPVLSLNFAAYSVDTGGAASLGWTDSQNETSYEVFRRIQGESEFAYHRQVGDWRVYLSSIFAKIASAAYANPLVTLLANTGYYIDQTVAEDMNYEYQVRAVNSKGATNSNIIPVYVPIAPPGVFTLSYSRIGLNKIKLIWTEAISTVKGGPVVYTVQKDSTNDFNSPADVSDCVEITALECVDASASALEKYYRVKARNNGGDTYSNFIGVILMLKWKEVIPR